ncbi:MAG: hypothetical protein ACRDMJ_18975, partial [Solirubrobacteraceae bacterium]
MSSRPELAAGLAGAGAGAGARRLASISSFGGEEPVRLPFELQRRGVAFIVIGALAMAAVAVATGVRPIVGVGMVAAVAAALAVALNEVLGLVLLAVLAASTSGLARGVPIPGVRFSEVLIGGVGIVLLTCARRFVRWSAVDWLALAYAVATFVIGGFDVLARGQALHFSELQTLLGPCQFLLLYRATVVTARTPRRRRLAMRLMIWASVPVSLLALGQQANFPGVRSLLVTLTRNNVYAAGSATARVTGPFPLWHNLGGYLLLILLATIALRMRRVEGVVRPRLMLAIALLDTVALVQTLDLGPLGGLVAGVVILGIWLGDLRTLSRAAIGAVIVAAIGMAVFGSRLDARFTQEFSRAPGAQRSALVPQTIQYRFTLWSDELLPLLRGHMVAGYGPRLPPQLQNFPYTESQYVNLLYRGGIVLLAVWAALFVAIGAAGARSTRDRDPFQHALGAAVATSVICLAFMQILEAYFVDDGTPQVLWMLLGLLSFHEPALGRV